MKIQKITLTAIALLFMGFFINSLIIEVRSFRQDKKHTFLEWILSRPDKTEQELDDSLKARELLFEYKGLFNRAIDKRYLYGIYKLPNGHLSTPSGKSGIRDKVRNLEELHEWCSDHGIEMLYVNLPAKSENAFFREYGVETFSGENADELLAELEVAGIDHLDMREFFSPGDLESLDIYFRTDHHWKISSGLFTARTLGNYINDQYHLGLKTEAIADEMMKTEFMPQSWVGESGRKTSIAFSGKEDFEYITPLDPGTFHLTIPSRKVDETGGFSVMINDSVFQDPDLYNDSYYYAYLFRNDPLQIIDNLDERYGKILIVKDSYAQAVNPFLAMTSDELISWDVRYNETDLRDYLTEHPVDLVVIMYTESFIQGRMFNFKGAQ